MLLYITALSPFPLQVGLIETNGELKVFIDQNLSPSKGMHRFNHLLLQIWQRDAILSIGIYSRLDVSNKQMLLFSFIDCMSHNWKNVS